MGRRLTGPAPGVVSSVAPEPTVERVPPEHWELIGDWDEVVAASARPSVFLTRDWAVSWWRSFGDGLEPWLVRVAEPGGGTIGVVPLYLERVRGGRRLGLVGDRSAGSEYLGMVARPGSEAEVGREALDHLAVEGGWDLAELVGLVDGDPAGAALELELRGRASRARVERHPCSAISLPADFDTYLAGLNSKFRQTYRQRANKLHRACAVRFFRTEAEDELEGHLEKLFRMHQARWTVEGYSGSFADPRMRRFYREVSPRLLAAGRLRFWHLEADGAIRASQFGFVYDGVLHSLQEGYDTEFRPPGVGGLGVVLRGHVIRSAIEEGLRAYDFLGGAEDFKTRWGTSAHHVRVVRAAARGPRGLAAWLAVVGAEDARALVRERAPRPLLAAVRAVRNRGRGAGPAVPE